MENEMLKYLSEYIPITDSLKKIISENDLFRSYRKKTVLLKKSEIAKECYFVIKGCIKRYYIPDGNEQITGFYTEGHVITPVSYINKLPSEYYLECIEDTIAFVGNSRVELDLYKKHPELESLTRIMTEKLIAAATIDFDYRTITNPKDKYLRLLKDRPDLIQRVPQNQIASYLRIQPESLSRLKKRLFKRL